MISEHLPWTWFCRNDAPLQVRFSRSVVSDMRRRMAVHSIGTVEEKTSHAIGNAHEDYVMITEHQKNHMPLTDPI